MAMGRRLLVYATAALLVRLADEGARVGLVLLAVERLDSAAIGGLLVAVLLVPHVVAAPLVGLLADRARRPSLVVAAASIGFGVALASTGAVLGSLPLPLVVVVLVLGGCCGPALTGALTSQLPALLPAERLPRAFGLDSLIYNVAGMAGPAVAAVLAAATSARVATLALGGAAVIGGMVVATLPVTGRPTEAAKIGARDLLGGVRVLLREPVLATVTASTTLGQLGAGALPVIAVLLAQRQHAPAAAGWLLTAMAAGALLGSLVWTWRPAAARRAPTVVMLGLIGTGLPLAAATWSSSLVLTAALFALSGCCNGPLFGALLTVRNEHAPAEFRSQVFTLSAGARLSTTAAGSALAGAAAGLPVTALLLAAAATAVVGGVGGQLNLRRYPRLDSDGSG
jgi:MFS family permease